MKRVPYVSIILENSEGEVLLLLRENKTTITCPNHWTLIGGKVEAGETPEMAAHRQLIEETGLRANLAFWKRYDREHPLFIVDQYIYTGKANVSQGSVSVRDSQDIQFVRPSEIMHMKIGYGFDALLKEYLAIGVR